MKNKEKQTLQQIAPYSADVLNPFELEQELSVYQIVKAVLITIFILPIRLFSMFLVLWIAWSIGAIAIKGVPEEQRRNIKPLSGWRRKWMKPFLVSLARLVFTLAGLHWIKTKGRRASPKEAPILLLVPHTSFWDTVPVISLGCPGTVMRDSTRNVPFFGSLLNYAQPVYVQRGDADSRQKTVDDILRRCRSGDDWEQVLICPEGTVGNGKALLEFKLGAFYPGVPVQPVFVKYPNKFDTITWAWEGPSALQQIWLSLTQFHIRCELEFLPVYYPNAAEKENPRLFAENVRQHVSGICKIPITHFSPEDVKYLSIAKEKKLPKTAAIVKLVKLRDKTGLSKLDVKSEQLVLTTKFKNLKSASCDVDGFAEFLGVEKCEPLKEFFSLMDQEKTEQIDVRAYLVGLWILRTDISEWKRIEKSFKVFDLKGCVAESDFVAISFLWRGIPTEVSLDIFHIFNMELAKKGSISFDIFKSVATSYKILEKNLHNSNGTNGVDNNSNHKESGKLKTKVS